MENVVIQALQFSRLMMLASAFGHWWARVLHEADPGRKVWTTSDIAAAQAAARAAEEKANPGWCFNGGIEFTMSHTTATGRLFWVVTTNGSALIEGHRRGDAVGRPGQKTVCVASLRVLDDGGVFIKYPLGVEKLSPGVVGAVITVLMALGVTEERAWQVLGPEAMAILAAERVEEANKALASAQKELSESQARRAEGSDDAEMQTAHQWCVERDDKALAAASASLASAWKMAEWAEMRRPPPLLPVRKWKTRYV